MQHLQEWSFRHCGRRERGRRMEPDLNVADAIVPEVYLLSPRYCSCCQCCWGSLLNIVTSNSGGPAARRKKEFEDDGINDVGIWLPSLCPFTTVLNSEVKCLWIWPKVSSQMLASTFICFCSGFREFETKLRQTYSSWKSTTVNFASQTTHDSENMCTKPKHDYR